MKRRTFVKVVGASIPAFTIVPRAVLGGKGYVAPSDKLNVAGIGIGGKGWENLTRAYDGGGTNIVALCDVDDRSAKDAREKWNVATYYKDYRTMLDKEGDRIDAVMVSTPDHSHAVQALEAMKSGKHVYCEKPLTHDIYEARMLTKAAEKYRVVTQMGNQGSSGDDTRYVETWIQSGLIGDVNKVHVWTNRPVWPQGIPTPTTKHKIPKELDWELWLGTAPYRHFNPIYVPANWRGWGDFGTGALGDMGCHFMDVPFRALRLGYPIAVHCSASAEWHGFFDQAVYTDSFPSASKIHLQFPARDAMPPLELVWYDGGILPDRPEELPADMVLAEWDGGIMFEGTKGKLIAGLFGRNPQLLEPNGKIGELHIPAPSKPLVPNGSAGHQTQWVNACKEGYGAYTSSPFSEAGPLTETVLMGNLAVRSYNFTTPSENKWKKYDFPGRKKLLWDGKNMKITNFEEANQFVRRNYRSNYTLEL